MSVCRFGDFTGFLKPILGLPIQMNLQMNQESAPAAVLKAASHSACCCLPLCSLPIFPHGSSSPQLLPSNPVKLQGLSTQPSPSPPDPWEPSCRCHRPVLTFLLSSPHAAREQGSAQAEAGSCCVRPVQLLPLQVGNRL